MSLEVFLDGSTVLRRVSGQGLGEALPPPEGATAMNALADWSARYGRAVRGRLDAALLQIGREMFDWLDQGQALDAWMAADPRALTIRSGSRDDPALAGALLAAPWELLADRTGFLAQDMRLFTVARQAHGISKAHAPDHKDISLLYMAAAPREQTPLDHEREEAVILEATRPRLGQPAPVHLQVEESGTLEFLAETARLQGPFEALHISCHGNIQPQDGGTPQPVLFLETDTGAPHAVTVDGLKTELDVMPRLLFLSACRTAERGKGQGLPLPAGYRDAGSRDATGGTQEAEPNLADPFVRQFSAFTGNVVGWDGSVYDSEATSFAATFYGELSRGNTVPDPRLPRGW